MCESWIGLKEDVHDLKKNVLSIGPFVELNVSRVDDLQETYLCFLVAHMLFFTFVAVLTFV